MTYHAPLFVLRAPLLPADVLAGWSGDLRGPAAWEGAEPPLASALDADRQLLRDRLRALLARPEVREAIFVASPSLEESLPHWLHYPESERAHRVERAVVRYLSRMATRPTPFGLFAGVSLGTLAPHTTLRLGAQSACRRHTRLDNDYLCALLQHLAGDAALAAVLRYRPNDSLWCGAGRVRYVEAGRDGTRRTYQLMAAEASPALCSTLALATDGATRHTLAQALVDSDTEEAEALAYVDALINSQVLVPELQLPVTGDEPLRTVIQELASTPATTPIAATLDHVRADLAALDAAPFTANVAPYRAIAQALTGLGVAPALDRLFQVDLVRPAPAATLGHSVVDEIMRGVELLRRLGRSRHRDPLERFREAFLTRYEGRAVPLLEALDEELGLGALLTETGDPSPVLRGLPEPAASPQTVVWDTPQTHLLALLGQALRDGAEEIVLSPEDIERLASADPPPLAHTFEVITTLFAASSEAIAAGNYRLHLEAVGGPPAGRLLGRFCHAEPALARALADLLAAEAQHEAEAIYADIVHLPEGRLGNILLRPLLRSHEITYLGRSGAPRAQQIPTTDLLLSLVHGRLVLHSARLGRRVVPRLTTAHNFASGLGVYRFLCLLQYEELGHSGMRWDWGPLETAPFLPRVRVGRCILSAARWRMSAADTRQLVQAQGVERYRCVQEWRRRHCLPRWVALLEGDNRLPVDLDNVLSIEAFVSLLTVDSAATLQEVLLGPDDLCLAGPDGRYTHELIVPFVRQVSQETAPSVSRQPEPTAILQHSAQTLTRRFLPGSEWLYAKLYTSPELTDEALLHEIGPVTRDLLDRGAASGWFFLRYADPDWHLRWRLHGDAGELQKVVLPAVQAAAARLLDRGVIWRFQLDTYEREVERYGGPQGMRLSEQLFQADSEAALDILAALEPDDAGLDERWLLTLRGMGDFLEDCGLDLIARRDWVQRVLTRYAKLVGPGGTYHIWANERYRAARGQIERLFDSRQEPLAALAPGLTALRRRSQHLAPVVAELTALQHRGQLDVPLATLARSYLHMHCFRLLRSAHGEHEPILLHFLSRIYQSQVARATGKERLA